MRKFFTCASCHKQGRNPDGIPIHKIEGKPYHASCYLREKAKQLKPIICPTCHREIKEGEQTIIAFGCMPRHADLNCSLKKGK